MYYYANAICAAINDRKWVENEETHRMTEMEYINVISLLFIGTIAMARGSFYICF